VQTYNIRADLPKKEDEPEFWAARLEPLLRELSLGISLAVCAAHRFFKAQKFNRVTFSCLIRYYLLVFLQARHFDPSEEDDDWVGWDTRQLSNNGIELRYNGSCIRIRNASGMPAPITASTRDFYQQVLFVDKDWEPVINLLVLFKLTPEMQYDGTLRLVRPSTGDESHANFEWDHKVKYPVLDPAEVVLPEYMRPPELPFEMNAEDDPNLFGDDTGTDPDGD